MKRLMWRSQRAWIFVLSGPATLFDSISTTSKSCSRTSFFWPIESHREGPQIEIAATSLMKMDLLYRPIHYSQRTRIPQARNMRCILYVILKAWGFPIRHSDTPLTGSCTDRLWKQWQQYGAGYGVIIPHSWHTPRISIPLFMHTTLKTRARKYFFITHTQLSPQGFMTRTQLSPHLWIGSWAHDILYSFDRKQAHGNSANWELCARHKTFEN